MDRWTTFRSCDRARESVSRGLDGELSPFEARLLSAHLLRCVPCREFEADAAALSEALRNAPLETLERPVALPRLRTPRTAHASAAAALAGAALLVLSVTGPLDFVDGTNERLSARETTAGTRILEDGEPFPADLPARADRKAETIQE